MRNFKNVLTIALFLMGATLFAQTKISGKVVDENNMALPGADVVIKGTTKGTNTDFDGKFSIECQNTTGTLVISFMGYESQSIEFNGSKDLGAIQLAPAASTLDEIVIVGVADIAKDRQTPVAVSTMKASEIVEKLGSKELPEVLNATPSVYATKAGGGFGDSRINIRGFDQRNTAILINGVAVNDMENGWVYFSNWAGLSDVASAMQIQRGLGSSKLAIASVGGTLNILTKTSDAKQGGAVSFAYRGEESWKASASYSTGLLESGLSASVLFSQDEGKKYADGTSYKGNSFFIGLGYKINDKHNVMLTATGAPQWHNQKYGMPISTFLNKGDGTTPNTKYNNNWGYYQGEEYNWSQNFYHKPIASLNWDWMFNETANLSTVIYGSWGRGGGTGSSGKINSLNTFDAAGASALYNADGLIRFDDIATWNAGGAVTGFGANRNTTLYPNNIYSVSSSGPRVGMNRTSSMNSHDWYGGLTNFHKDFNDKLGFDFGVDVRTYKAYHYKTLNDLLGAPGYVNVVDVNSPNTVFTKTYDALPAWNPFVNISTQEKVDRNYNGYVNWLGAFTQLEYKGEKLSAFVQGGVSKQGFRREDLFYYLDSDDKQMSDWKKMLGGNVKGGLNYNLNDKHNVFANAGYYSKQPLFTAVFVGSGSTPNDIRENLINETIIGYEVGYGYRSQSASVNVNLYRTTWNDRYQRSNTTTVGGIAQYTDFRGINELHQGVEIEGSFKPSSKLKLMGMVSVGDWIYQGNATGTVYDATTNEPLTGAVNTELFLDQVKVGDAAQFTARLGLEWNAFENFKFDVSQQYFDKLYAALSASAFTREGIPNLLLPSYSLTDMGVSYKIDLFKSLKTTFRFNVDNVFDHIYISESSTNNYIKSQADYMNSNGTPNTTAYNTYLTNLKTYQGIDQTNSVNFGWGRTWSASVRFDF